jgi:hypothetical protein
VVIPGLAKMTAAPDFTGRLDLYDGVLTESGGGMTMQARVLAGTDPAWPADWDVSGTVYLRGRTRIDVQVHNGTTVTAAIEAGATHRMLIRNPWPGQRTQIVDGCTGAVVVSPAAASSLILNAQAGHSYLIEPVSDPTTALPYAPVTGTAATSASHLGGVQIGLDPATS